MKNYIISRVLLLTVFISIFSSCKKDKDEHPEIQTLIIEALSPTKAILKGNIVSKGSFSIVDHGFVYGTTSNLSEVSGTKVSLGNSVTEGLISKEVQSLNYYGSSTRILYARAYLTNSNGTVFGQVMSVQLPTVTTGTILPASGKIGDQITINGQFHSLTKDEVSVTFGGITAKIVEVSSSKLIVEVPAGINTYNSSYNQVSLAVYVGGQTIYQSYTFKVIPTLKAFTPTSGPVGTSVTITGDNIPNSYSNTVKVFFGQAQTTISSLNSNGIVALVPGNVTELKVPVSVEVDGIKITLPGEFTLTAPTVTTISPSAGLPGGTFSIFGSNFPNNYYSNTNYTVTIGGIPASVSWVSSGQLTVTIPTNMPVGDYKVVVKSGPFNVEAAQTLKVQALTVTSFSPGSGGVGKEITIQGLFVTNQSYQVYFGSMSSYATALSSTTLKANVPFGTTPGNTKILVKYGSQTAESSDDFTVLAPSITSFSPTSGVAGTTVTISGSGFNPYTYNNTVRFGTVQAPILSATESSLVVTVPSNITPAAMKITVINNGQTIVSSGNFTVN